MSCTIITYQAIVFLSLSDDVSQPRLHGERAQRRVSIGQQLRRPAHLGDLPPAQHNDPVRVQDGAQAVSDRDHRAVGELFADRGLKSKMAVNCMKKVVFSTFKL